MIFRYKHTDYCLPYIWCGKWQVQQSTLLISLTLVDETLKFILIIHEKFHWNWTSGKGEQTRTTLYQLSINTDNKQHQHTSQSSRYGGETHIWANKLHQFLSALQSKFNCQSAKCQSQSLKNSNKSRFYVGMYQTKADSKCWLTITLVLTSISCIPI